MTTEGLYVKLLLKLTRLKSWLTVKSFKHECYFAWLKLKCKLTGRKPTEEEQEKLMDGLDLDAAAAGIRYVNGLLFWAQVLNRDPDSFAMYRLYGEIITGTCQKRADLIRFEKVMQVGLNGFNINLALLKAMKEVGDITDGQVTSARNDLEHGRYVEQWLEGKIHSYPD